MSSETVLIERFSPLRVDSPSQIHRGQRRSRRRKRTRTKKSQSQTRELGDSGKITVVRPKRTRKKDNNLKESRRDIFLPHTTENVTAEMDSDGERTIIGGSHTGSTSSTTPIVETSPSVAHSGFTTSSSPLNCDNLCPVDLVCENFHSGDVIATGSTSSLALSPSHFTEDIGRLTDGGAALKLKLSELLWKLSNTTQTPQGKRFYKVLTKVCQGAVTFVDSIIQCQNIIITPNTLINPNAQQSVQNTQCLKAVTEVIQCINTLATLVPSAQLGDQDNQLKSNDLVDEQWYQDPLKYLKMCGLAPKDFPSYLHQEECRPLPAGHGDDIRSIVQSNSMLWQGRDTGCHKSEHDTFMHQEDMSIGMEVVVSSSELAPSSSGLIHGSNIPVISDVYSLLGDSSPRAASVRTNGNESLGSGSSTASISAQSSYTSRYSSHVSSLSVTDSLQTEQLKLDRLVYSEAQRSPSIVSQRSHSSCPCDNTESHQPDIIHYCSSLKTRIVPAISLSKPAYSKPLINNGNALSADKMSAGQTTPEQIEAEPSETSKVCAALFNISSDMADVQSSIAANTAVETNIHTSSMSETSSSRCSLKSNVSIRTKQPTVLKDTMVTANEMSPKMSNKVQVTTRKIPAEPQKDYVSAHNNVQNSLLDSLPSTKCDRHDGNGAHTIYLRTDPGDTRNSELNKSDNADQRKGKLSRNKNGGCKKKTKCVASQTQTKEETITALLTDLKSKLRRTKRECSPALTRSASKKRSRSHSESRKRERSKTDEPDESLIFVKKFKVDAVPQNITIGSPVNEDVSETVEARVDRDKSVGISDALSKNRSQNCAIKCHNIAIQTRETRDVAMQTDPVTDTPDNKESWLEPFTLQGSREAIKHEPSESSDLSVTSSLPTSTSTNLCIPTAAVHTSESNKRTSVGSSGRKLVKSVATRRSPRSRPTTSAGCDYSSSKTGSGIEKSTTPRSTVSVNKSESVTASVRSVNTDYSEKSQTPGQVSSRKDEVLTVNIKAELSDNTTNEVLASNTTGEEHGSKTSFTGDASVSKEHNLITQAPVKDSRKNKIYVVCSFVQNVNTDSQTASNNMGQKRQLGPSLSAIFTPEVSSSEISVGREEFCQCTDDEPDVTERPELFPPSGRNTRNSTAVRNWDENLVGCKAKDNSTGTAKYTTEPSRSRRGRSVVVKSPQDEVIGNFHKRGFQYTNECFAILDSVYNLPAAYAFRPEVTSSEDTEYHKVVKFPMCLDTMTYRLRQRLYAKLDDVIKDMRRIFWNCRLYYPVGSQVRADCDILEKSLEDKIAVTFPEKDFTAITGSPPIRHFQQSSRRRTRSTDKASPPILGKHGKLPGELRSLFG